MFGFEKVALTFSFSAVWFIIALLVLAGYTFYVYRYTVPPVRPLTKAALITLRFLALLSLLFFIFEPVLTLTKKNLLQPVHLFFVDNSRSVQIADGTNRKEKEEQFVEDALASGVSGNSEFYTFGTNINKSSSDSIKYLTLNDGSTNFSNIFSAIKKDNRNIASVAIVSDGVVTSGSKPLFDAEKLNIPIFTVGLGDTTIKKDVFVKNVLFNEFIYVKTPTTILSEISSHGFEGKQITASLYENDIPVEQKNITLSQEGFQSVSFDYLPRTGGEKKMSISVTTLPGEENKNNNKKLFYINVLDNKLKVLLLSGAPSQDLSFIRSSLKLDENISVSSITVFDQNKIIEIIDPSRAIDSSDIIFLIGFPSKQTPPSLIQKTIDAIAGKNKPFFFLLENSTDYALLNSFQKTLSFIPRQGIQKIYEVQPSIGAGDLDNPLLQNNSSNPADAWNNLPPVYQPSYDFKAKPGSDVLSNVKINNVPLNRPLIITQRISFSRSISVLAFDIWKWKLQTAQKNLNLFDSFILNSVKWLNTTNDQKKVRIATSKKLYSPGEPVEFTAQVYDESFNPISDSEIRIKIKGPDKSDILLNSLGGGLYEGSFNANFSGDFTFDGMAILKGKNLGADKGKFNIGEVDIEKIDDRMDYEFLNSLSKISGGSFYFAGNTADLFNRLETISENSSKEKLTLSEINLWSNQWLMIAAIFFFALEWFMRKRAGML